MKEKDVSQRSKYATVLSGEEGEKEEKEEQVNPPTQSKQTYFMPRNASHLPKRQKDKR
jgi:hypothetical protein